MSPTAVAAPAVSGSQDSHAQHPPGNETSAAHDVKGPFRGSSDKLVSLLGAAPSGSPDDVPAPRQDEAIGGQALDGRGTPGTPSTPRSPRTFGTPGKPGACDSAPQASANGAQAHDIGEVTLAGFPAPSTSASCVTLGEVRQPPLPAVAAIQGSQSDLQNGRSNENLEKAGHPKSLEYLKFVAEELDRVCQEASGLLRMTKFVSSTLVTITITLNALIIGGKTLNLEHRLVALFALVNTVIKGIEVHFQIDHVHHTLRNGVGKLKDLDTEVHGMINSKTVSSKQIDDFKKMYDSAMELVAEYISPRGARDFKPLLDGNGSCCARLCCRRRKPNSKIAPQSFN